MATQKNNKSKSFQDYLKRKQREYGKKFNTDKLAKQFIPYYESGERLKIKFASGDTKQGTIEITTGWNPFFILVLTKDSISSPWLLGKTDKILSVITPKERAIRDSKEYKRLNHYLASAIAEGFCEGEGASEFKQKCAWQYLVDTGFCWKLQGWFSRTAQSLIENGIIESPKKDNVDFYGSIVKGGNK